MRDVFKLVIRVETNGHSQIGFISPGLRNVPRSPAEELSDVPGVRTVAMTSNGLALARRLPALQRAGLSALNLSLDSLRPERFEAMARRPVSAASPPTTPHHLAPRPTGPH